MALPTIASDDLLALGELGADLSFGDAERRAVLLENASRDINAAPGSGKTTVLTAKLWLLARKWTAKHQGICMLSHTNVAREEIERRLGVTCEGRRLLGYPHYIGTIHGFVDRFLALPLLRSVGGAVKTIDDQVFARRALAMSRGYYKLRAWVRHQPQSRDSIIEGLVYRGKDLRLATESDADGIPKSDGPVLEALTDIEHRLSSEGIYRYADMFAYAAMLLSEFPTARAALSRRFPYVFIDEMQDTSWLQEGLLEQMFDESVVMQRYGDVNQRILVEDADSSKLSFPHHHALNIATSKRFGPSIAAVVSGVRPNAPSVVGEGADLHPPTLMLYCTERVGEVIGQFGAEVIERFGDATLSAGRVAAICARKASGANQAPGRMLPDYWPAYGQGPPAQGGEPVSIWPLVGRDGKLSRGGGVDEAVRQAKRALWIVLRESGCSVIAGLHDSVHWLSRLREVGHDIAPLRALMRQMALSSGWGGTAENRRHATSLLFNGLAGWLPTDLSLADFQALDIFSPSESSAAPNAQRFSCELAIGLRRVDIAVGTVATMKGQTHLATLVLESFGHRSRKFDLAEALPIVAGLPKSKYSDAVHGQMRNLYVAMSRPTSFLCVAANVSRVSEACVDALLAKGWTLRRLDPIPTAVSR